MDYWLLEIYLLNFLRKRATLKITSKTKFVDILIASDGLEIEEDVGLDVSEMKVDFVVGVITELD